jgi:hypothetical protein
MATTATLQLYDPVEDNMTTEEQQVLRPIVTMPFAQAQSIMVGGLMNFLKTPRKTLRLLKDTMAGITRAFGLLSPENRELLNIASGEAGFLAGVNTPILYPRDTERQTEWATKLGNFISTQRGTPSSSDVGNQGQPEQEQEQEQPTGGCRGCGCGTPGCNKGGGAKLSPGFLAKVRKLLR